MKHRKYVYTIAFTIVCFLFIIFHNHIFFSRPDHLTTLRKGPIPLFVSNHSDSHWISPSLYNEFRSYTQSRKAIQESIKSIVKVGKGTYKIEPLNKDYIKFTKKNSWNDYPYSSWKCSITSNKDPAGAEYCYLTNIYYDSSNNQYYYYRSPSEIQINMTRNKFISSHSRIHFNIIDNITNLTQKGVSAILTRSVYITGPPDRDYAHGFLERCAAQFWVLAEFQSHPSFIDPTKIQIYYSSTMNNDSAAKLWHKTIRQRDGTYRRKAKWLDLLQSMFSIYPLLTLKSFNHLIQDQ